MIPTLRCICIAFAFGQLPTVDLEGFKPEMQRQALLSTVRVHNKTRNVLGSGVMLERDGTTVFILTAAHVVAGAEELTVDVFSAKSHPQQSQRFNSASVIACAKDKQPDLAVLRVIGYDGEAKGLKLGSMKESPKQKAVRAISVGCAELQAPTVRAETLLDVVRARRGDESKSSLFIRAESAPTIGRSGGPLVDARGQLLGICSGVNQGRGFYCHVDEIERFLNAQGLLPRAKSSEPRK